MFAVDRFIAGSLPISRRGSYFGKLGFQLMVRRHYKVNLTEVTAGPANEDIAAGV
jgi:hypothetical protein